MTTDPQSFQDYEDDVFKTVKAAGMVGCQFNPGDIVQLNSGGPKMTVTHTGKEARDISTDEIITTRAVFCVWFRDGCIFNADFHPKSIHRYSRSLAEDGKSELEANKSAPPKPQPSLVALSEGGPWITWEMHRNSPVPDYEGKRISAVKFADGHIFYAGSGWKQPQKPDPRAMAKLQNYWNDNIISNCAKYHPSWTKPQET